MYGIHARRVLLIITLMSAHRDFSVGVENAVIIMLRHDLKCTGTTNSEWQCAMAVQ